ncbi:ATP-dependent DNA ligase [Bacillus sp. SG-1]|nr:ATP-dependent DNA ligase [Bacillus sp. SG-1]
MIGEKGVRPPAGLAGRLDSAPEVTYPLEPNPAGEAEEANPAPTASD